MSIFTRNFLDINNAERPQGALQQVGTLDVENIRRNHGNETAGMTDQQVEAWYQTVGNSRNIAQNTLTPDAIHADLTYDRREDWERRFSQFEDLSIANSMDTERLSELRGQALGITNDAVNNSLDRKDNRIETYLSRMGQRRNSAESAGTQRANAVAKNATMTKSRNDTRGYLNQRENSLLGIGAS